jgi:hypothetical protein
VEFQKSATHIQWRYVGDLTWTNLVALDDLKGAAGGGAGAIGTTAGLPIITGANGVLQAGSFGTTAGTFAQGNDARIASSIASAGTRTITDERIMTEAEYAAITPNPTTLYFII